MKEGKAQLAACKQLVAIICDPNLEGSATYKVSEIAGDTRWTQERIAPVIRRLLPARRPATGSHSWLRVAHSRIYIRSGIPRESRVLDRTSAELQPEHRTKDR